MFPLLKLWIPRRRYDCPCQLQPCPFTRPDARPTPPPALPLTRPSPNFADPPRQGPLTPPRPQRDPRLLRRPCHAIGPVEMVPAHLGTSTSPRDGPWGPLTQGRGQKPKAQMVLLVCGLAGRVLAVRKARVQAGAAAGDVADAERGAGRAAGLSARGGRGVEAVAVAHGLGLGYSGSFSGRQGGILKQGAGIGYSVFRRR